MVLSISPFLTPIVFAIGDGIGNEQGGNDARGEDADGSRRRVPAGELKPQPCTAGELPSAARERGVAF